MERFTPVGWRCSDAGRRKFTEMESRMTALVVRRIQNYHHVPGMERGDLFQEGMFIAMYAVDTFDPARGVKLETYVGKVIERHLALVASKAMAQCRAPRRYEQSGEEWLSVLDSGTGVDPDTLPSPIPGEEQENRRCHLRRLDKARRLAAATSERITQLTATVMAPPPEAVVAARNAAGRPPRPSEVVAVLGLPRQAVLNASLEYRARAKKCRQITEPEITQ